MTGESNGPLVTAQLALGLPELWDETDVWSGVKVALRDEQTVQSKDSDTTDVRGFKGERAETEVRKFRALHTLQAPFQGNKHVMQSTSFNM